ncbi:hypothetical protein SLA2020_522120 [Shorea laevis]
MLPKGIEEVRIRDTGEHVLRFFNMQSSLIKSEVANLLLHANFEEFEVVNRIQSKLVLPRGCKLALNLQALVEKSLWDHEGKWKMIADIWIEMLVFAANKCEWREHATQLRNGPELLTHVALLMVHFGLTKHIRISKGEPSSISNNREEEIVVDSSQ